MLQGISCRRRAMPKIADIEYTPNPNAVKFILREPITGGSSRSFQNAESAHADPLAAALFAVRDVTSVYYMDRFIAVNKEDEVSWEEMLKKLAAPIRAAGAVSEAPVQAQAPVYTPGESTLLDRINQALDEKVRPGLAGDGGGLEIIGLDDKK